MARVGRGGRPTTAGLHWAAGQRNHLNNVIGRDRVDERLSQLQERRGAYKEAGKPSGGLGLTWDDLDLEDYDDDLSDEDIDALTHYHDD